MSALPVDIAESTVDGVVVTLADAALRALIPDALDLGDSEIETFFDSPADASAMLSEKFAILKNPDRRHEAVEIGDTAGIGTVWPLFPRVPLFRLTDPSRDVDAQVPIRAFVDDGDTDRFSIEFLE